MKRKKIRTDLISKQDYHKRYGTPRPKINDMIESGKLSVEEISGTEYIKIA